jgi:hypothetical protein
MEIELNCSKCVCYFAAPTDTEMDGVYDRMEQADVWLALGLGETFEEMIASALLARGAIRCPRCLEPMQIRDTKPASRTAWSYYQDWSGERQAQPAGRCA